jgi:hypothetical protein
VSGRTDGNGVVQDVKGHIGGKSVALLHMGCIRPLMHWQVQDGQASDIDRRPINSAKMKARIVLLRAQRKPT